MEQRVGRPADRRVNGDRSFQNFAQTTDLRSGSLRWRARPAATASAEAEARVTWQRATQAQVSGGSFERTLVEQAGVAQWIWQPDVQWKVAAALEAAWARTPGQTEPTRTVAQAYVEASRLPPRTEHPRAAPLHPPGAVNIRDITSKAPHSGPRAPDCEERHVRARGRPHSSPPANDVSARTERVRPCAPAAAER